MDKLGNEDSTKGKLLCHRCSRSVWERRIIRRVDPIGSPRGICRPEEQDVGPGGFTQLDGKTGIGELCYPEQFDDIPIGRNADDRVGSETWERDVDGR